MKELKFDIKQKSEELAGVPETPGNIQYIQELKAEMVELVTQLFHKQALYTALKEAGISLAVSSCGCCNGTGVKYKKGDVSFKYDYFDFDTAEDDT